MIIIWARILLYSFGMCISLFPLLEAGHEILHQFKNAIHHHSPIRHQHNLADHQVKHHDDQDEAAEGINLISLLFGLTRPAEKVQTSFTTGEHCHQTLFLCMYVSVTHCPPTPPPLT
jgi:hypothetical protein